MSDLSRWQFLEVFTALEASALICGSSPEKAIFRNEFFGDRVLGDVIPVYKRISSSYGDARVRCVISLEVEPAHLQSVLLCNMRELAEYQGETSASSEILNSSEANLDKQEFSRIEIARWLKHHNFNSAFKFDLDGLDAPPENPVQSRPEKWPWGNHNTQHLDHLEAAARRWWVNYNPEEIDTAPTNGAVSTWLVSERKVSKTMADAMASILRADGLRTGPREIVVRPQQSQ